MPHALLDGRRLYYEFSGSGSRTLLLLHGNTASSRMFLPVRSLYERRFRLLLMDFVGHGSSDRLPGFPADLWFNQSMQAAALLDRLCLHEVDLLGTSGGALAALNLALERPDLVRRLIADSFEGERSLDAVAATIADERQRAKSAPGAITFWRDCHGGDWENVVDNDTRAILAHHETIGRFFHKDLKTLAMPVLLTASLEDEFAGIARFPETYARLSSLMRQGGVYLFPTGGHPAMLSNPELFFELAADFFS